MKQPHQLFKTCDFFFFSFAYALLPWTSMTAANYELSEQNMNLKKKSNYLKKKKVMPYAEFFILRTFFKTSKRCQHIKKIVNYILIVNEKRRLIVINVESIFVEILLHMFHMFVKMKTHSIALETFHICKVII